MDNENEAGLIWARYNAMIVASTVLLGLLSILADKDMSPKLGLYLSVIGIGTTIVWVFVTCQAWSLLHYRSTLLRYPTFELYKIWRKKRRSAQDPIWQLSIGLIVLFYFMYAGFAAYYIKKVFLLSSFDGICVGGGMTLMGVVALLYFYTFMNPKAAEIIAKNDLKNDEDVQLILNSIRKNSGRNDSAPPAAE